nr:ubiquitin carboxyl-terminal hydrolase 2-like [Penaeus vannamei]
MSCDVSVEGKALAPLFSDLQRRNETRHINHTQDVYYCVMTSNRRSDTPAVSTECPYRHHKDFYRDQGASSPVRELLQRRPSEEYEKGFLYGMFGQYILVSETAESFKLIVRNFNHKVSVKCHTQKLGLWDPPFTPWLLQKCGKFQIKCKNLNQKDPTFLPQHSQGTQTPGSSSYPGDYWPSTDPRNKQSFPDPAASPSEEDEKGFVQTHQESKILEENAVTKQQEGFEPRTACLPDSKDKEESNFDSPGGRVSKSEISSPSHQHYGADRDNISAEKRNPSMPFPASPSAEEHQFKSHEHPQATDPQPSRAPTKLALEASKRKSDGETYQETLHKKARKSSGLPNLGNTCYMNSVLQCLYHTTELTEFLLSEDGRSNTNAGPVTKAFTELLKRMMNNANPKFELRELKRVVGERDPEFAGSRQREAHDFLAMMQTWLSKELEEDTEDLKIKDITIPNLRPSFPVELFNGIHCSTFICERKNRVFLRKYEPFSNLTLAVTSMSSNMEDVLKRYYESQMITWTCKLCQEDHECRHDTRIYRLPRVLIVHFSRYNLSAIGTSRKAVVYCPPVLKLDSYLHSDVKRGQEYELYASCTHQGRMTGGHYIAHHMDPSGKWTLFDDSYVKHDVEANIDKAHILFYRARRMDLVTHLSELGPQS